MNAFSPKISFRMHSVCGGTPHAPPPPTNVAHDVQHEEHDICKKVHLTKILVLLGKGNQK